MTNKQIKELVTNLENTLVSIQNDRNRESLNLKLYKDRLSIMEAKNDSKYNLLLNRNEQIKEMSDRIKRLKGENQSLNSEIEGFA